MDRIVVPRPKTLKEKMPQFPSGTVFRWCPQLSNLFDRFSPGQRAEMVQEVSNSVAVMSMLVVEPYDKGKCSGRR